MQDDNRGLFQGIQDNKVGYHVQAVRLLQMWCR